MSSQQPSSSLPIPPTFQDDGSPALFLAWLEERIANLLDPQLDKQTSDWTASVAALVPVLFMPSPSESNGVWNALHEQIRLCEISLRLVDHALRHVPLLFKDRQILPEVFLMNFTILCTSLDLWIEFDPPPDDEYITPHALYDRTRRVLAEVLQALGEEVDPTLGPVFWAMLRDLVARCAGLVNGVCGSFPG